MQPSNQPSSDIGIPGYGDFRLLGRGGFAAVYSARQIDYDRRVAVKILDIGINDDGLRRRVQRERAATGRLTGHPNIITILDSGFLADGRPFLTMALCPQGSLADRVTREGPLPIADVLHVGVLIAGALETAHRVDVIHRDIKPENILITPLGEPALADFGIATVADQRSMTRNTQAYTPNHAPPEVLRGEPAGVASDVYNLGSTLYQLLAGHPPFALSGSAGLAVFVDKVLNSEAPPPRDDLPESLLGVLRKAMAKDAAARYTTAAELGEALRGVQQELRLQVDSLPVMAISAEEERTAAPRADATVLPPTPTSVPLMPGLASFPEQPGQGQATQLGLEAPRGAATPQGPDATVLPPTPGMTFAGSPAGGSATRMAAPPPPPVTPPAPPRSDEPKPRRLLVPVLIVVLVIAGLGGGAYAAWTFASGKGKSTPPAAAPSTGPSPASSDGPASASPSSAASQSSSPSSTPKPTGPMMTSIVVKNITCLVNSEGGPWEGQFDVSWAAVQADHVQLYGPTAKDSLGGFDGAKGDATFAFPCTPNGTFLLRAVPQSQSTAGQLKDYQGKWPDGTDVTSFTVSNAQCVGGEANVDLTWKTRNATAVSVFVDGVRKINLNASGTYGPFKIDCTPGAATVLRVVAYNGPAYGGSRDKTLKW
ncbi:protein kinase [Dactylosporangium sp. NPDC051484]|uniref:serine/threonine-protein kinase n=1 Tax=Dactylosporangium sp. NPDC051484 TaxID=3154942 RepID=UPI00344BFEAC